MVSQGRSSDNSMIFTRNPWLPTSIFRFRLALQRSIRKALKMTPKLNPKRCRSPSRNNVKKHAPKCTLFWSKRVSSFWQFSYRKHEKRSDPESHLRVGVKSVGFFVLFAVAARILKDSLFISSILLLFLYSKPSFSQYTPCETLVFRYSCWVQFPEFSYLSHKFGCVFGTLFTRVFVIPSMPNAVLRYFSPVALLNCFFYVFSCF